MGGGEVGGGGGMHEGLGSHGPPKGRDLEEFWGDPGGILKRKHTWGTASNMAEGSMPIISKNNGGGAGRRPSSTAVRTEETGLISQLHGMIQTASANRSIHSHLWRTI